MRKKAFWKGFNSKWPGSRCELDIMFSLFFPVWPVACVCKVLAHQCSGCRALQVSSKGGEGNPKAHSRSNILLTFETLITISLPLFIPRLKWAQVTCPERCRRQSSRLFAPSGGDFFLFHLSKAWLVLFVVTVFVTNRYRRHHNVSTNQVHRSLESSGTRESTHLLPFTPSGF